MKAMRIEGRWLCNDRLPSRLFFVDAEAVGTIFM